MSAESRDGCFPTTHWTLVARLRSSDGATARRAIEDLCAQYRYPLYCVIRHRGLSHHDSEDALHDFLGKLLRLDSFADADPEKGRLRAFLSVALTRFIANWRRDHAVRAREVGLDDFSFNQDEEVRYQAERFPDHETPERIFDRQWARELLARVLARLADDYTNRGKRTVFDILSPVLQAGGSLRGEDTARFAAALGLSASGLRSTHQRFLKDYGDLLEVEVLQTVSHPSEVDEEIAHLRAAFRKD
jgi:DNA-directed RNA polymerase specialized sigma24 family protein